MFIHLSGYISEGPKFVEDHVCVYTCVCLSQSCPTLCDPKDCKLPGSSVHGILQARILEWVAISSSGEIFLIHGIKPMSPVSPALQADSLPAEPIVYINMHQIVL